MDHLQQHERLLRRINAMWNDPRVQFYNHAEIPTEDELRDGSVFLAGPTSRLEIPQFNWRSAAVEYLRQHGYKGSSTYLK